jgi:hypothetical protein
MLHFAVSLGDAIDHLAKGNLFGALKGWPIGVISVSSVQSLKMQFCHALSDASSESNLIVIGIRVGGPKRSGVKPSARGLLKRAYFVQLSEKRRW